MGQELLLKRQNEFVKVLCTFRLFREEVPLVEALALATEEQNSDVFILVMCLGIGSSSHAICVL